MNLDDYQTWLCVSQWQGYPLHSVIDYAPDTHAALRSLMILTAGLGGEAGEATEHLKKYVRDGKLDNGALALELGDVLAYMTWIARAIGYSLEEIAELNYKKLVLRGKKQS